MAVARQISIDEFERMIAANVFPQDENIELIRGELVRMPPIGPDHAGGVAGLNLLLQEQLGRNALVWVQGPIRLPEQSSRPQPDVAVLRWRDDLYRGRLPGAEVVLLLIEVAYSSLDYDRTIKATIYAEAGIPEYWVVNLVEDVVEVYSEPGRGGYAKVRRAVRGETLDLRGELVGSLTVADILG